jgi:hypothetical protein
VGSNPARDQVEFGVGIPDGVGPFAATVEVQWQVSSTDPVDHPVTDHPLPDGAIVRTPGSYPDLAAVGRELDAQELKLDAILTYLAASGIIVPRDGPPETETPHVADPDTKVDLKNAAGVILRATTVSPNVDVQFGPPKTYDGLGKVVFGSNGGYGPVMAINCDPMVIVPIPKGADGMWVTYFVPSSGTYQLIPKV